MSDLSAPVGQSTVAWQGHVGMVQQADKRFVEFFYGQKPNAAQSEALARPQFDRVVMIKIIHPGERDVHIMEAREHHQFEFPRQWAAFQAGQTDEVASGTPIDTIYPSEPALVKQFQQLHIYTVEQLAGLTEQGISRLGMGGRTHVERATKFLEHSNRMAGASQLQRELDAANDRADAMAEKMALMERQIAALAEGEGRRRRRGTDETDKGEG